jgi:hypothetical protein
VKIDCKHFGIEQEDYECWFCFQSSREVGYYGDAILNLEVCNKYPKNQVMKDD